MKLNINSNEYLIIGILIMITIMIIIIEKDLTSSCNEKTRLIFENVTRAVTFQKSS